MSPGCIIVRVEATNDRTKVAGTCGASCGASCGAGREASEFDGYRSGGRAPGEAPDDAREPGRRDGFRGEDVGRLRRVLRAGDVVVDVKNFLVWVDGEPVGLRLREFQVLAALAWRPGETRARAELAAEIWGRTDARALRAVKVQVRRLRVALSRHSSFPYVRTVRGSGYRLAIRNPADPDDAPEGAGGREPPARHVLRGRP